MTKNNKNENIITESRQTYLPLSEHCLAPKFLASESAVNVFVNLLKESLNESQVRSTLPMKEVLLGLSGLTEEQKQKAIEAAKELEKHATHRKLEPQF